MATSPPALSIDGTPQPANQNELDGLAERVQPYARAHFGSVYAGLEVRSAQDRIRVYRKPSADFDGWVLRDFAADCVEVVDAPHAEAELRALLDRMGADLPYWQSKGVPINAVSTKVDGSGVEATTTDVERAQRELAQRYGADAPIIVVYGGPIVPAIGSAQVG